MAHTFDISKAENLEDHARFRYCSREELIPMLGEDIERVVDIGSGTGFYSREVAPYVDTLVGLDIQPAMHRLHREHGLTGNTRLVIGDMGAIPVGTESLDATFSTMTFHEFATPESLIEVRRVLRPEGRFATVDWSANGEAQSGPSLAERHSAESATSLLRDVGFEILTAVERPETFAIVARNPGR